MIQAGSQSLTLHSLWTEWIRDWKTSPHDEAFYGLDDWYRPQIASIRERLASAPELVTAI
jgi:hypothetical protein